MLSQCNALALIVQRVDNWSRTSSTQAVFTLDFTPTDDWIETRDPGREAEAIETTKEDGQGEVTCGQCCKPIQ